MLALGLNIVVGFAGLLDLGFVAFYALGAYVVGWFASSHFNEVSFSFGSAARPDERQGAAGDTRLVLDPAPARGGVLGALRHDHRFPTLRLRGDYLAIVTLGFGEIIPRFFQNGDDSSASTSPTAPSASRP